MVKHIILWKLRDEYSPAQKREIARGVKIALEALNGQIGGLISLKILTQKLPSSNADMMLVSEFENEAALKAYATHPAHVEAANGFVRPFVETRLCLDYEE